MRKRTFLIISSVSIIFLIGAGAWLLINPPHRPPEYEVVDIKELSNFDLDQSDGTASDVPIQFRKLDGHRVKIVGDMWAPQSNNDGKLDSFQLVDPDLKHHSGPGGPPLAQQFIRVTVEKPAQVYYSEDSVALLGVFHIQLEKEGNLLKSIFHIEAESAH